MYLIYKVTYALAMEILENMKLMLKRDYIIIIITKLTFNPYKESSSKLWEVVANNIHLP